MTTRSARLPWILALGVSLGTASLSYGVSPEPCKILTPEAWGGIMGYAATAIPGDGNCTYEGANKAGGGQFRIMAVTSSSAEAESSVRRMRERQAHSSHGAGLSVIDSQGPVVFSVALFQHAATDGSAAQLQKLAAAAKQHLPK